MENVVRVNLKTDCGEMRKELIEFCLFNEEQFLAIGWSSIYEKGTQIKSYDDFYQSVKEHSLRINPALNVFKNTKEGDLFWTRDLDGNYWICRAKAKAQARYEKNMDIGAVIPIEAYKHGLEVPGQIKAAFNRPRGGIVSTFYDEIIIDYSKYIYNSHSNKDTYKYRSIEGELLDNLSDFDLEELVIAYIQIKENYYLLSNSIANKSTTVKIECEFMGREKGVKRKAVVQVKGGRTRILDALDYESYSKKGYSVYLYAPTIKNLDKLANGIEITRDDLMKFYNEYKDILPDYITIWEKLFGKQ